MHKCYNNGDFKKHFDDNMKAMNLPVPSTLFDNFTAAIANAGLILETLNALGRSATIAEVIKATTGLEKLKVAASIGAAYYVGALIGSIAVATRISLGCGNRISDMFVMLKKNNLLFDNWDTFYLEHPEVLDDQYHYRGGYLSKAISNPKRAYT